MEGVWVCFFNVSRTSTRCLSIAFSFFSVFLYISHLFLYFFKRALGDKVSNNLDISASIVRRCGTQNVPNVPLLIVGYHGHYQYYPRLVLFMHNVSSRTSNSSSGWEWTVVWFLPLNEFSVPYPSSSHIFFASWFPIAAQTELCPAPPSYIHSLIYFQGSAGILAWGYSLIAVYKHTRRTWLEWIGNRLLWVGSFPLTYWAVI